jgi:ABC-type uncharacterized transport system involved in gliding motility auxiliary subunit
MRSALRTGVTLIVILLVFLAFNLVWIAKLPNFQWDFSQQKTHTLSPPVQKQLAALENPLDLYYFNANNHRRKSYALQRYGKRIEELLKQYEKAAKGMINLHLIEPKPFSEDAYKARLSGLDDEVGFLGLIGTRAGHGARRIESFSLDREPLLEYEISHLIHKLQHPEPPAVGLLSGLALGESSGQLLKELQPYFKLVHLESVAEQIPEHIKTLMVVRPRELSEPTLFAIEQFVLRGGKLMIFIDPVSEQRSDTPPTNNRVDDLLATWGIQMPADKLLVDSRYMSMQTSGPDMPMTRHPARLALPRQAMNTNDISTWNLHTLSVSSSGALSRFNKSRTTFVPLLQSSEQSALVDIGLLGSNATVDSLIVDTVTPGQRYVIAARIEGPGYSAFPDGVKGQPPGLQKAELIHVVIVANTSLLMDQTDRSEPHSNALFVLNTLDNLSAPPALASIRPHTMTHRSQNVLEQMRSVAEQAYRAKANELEQRLRQTEQQWQLLTPRKTTLGTQAVDTSPQLQVLNKERLRLPMELHALQIEAYAQVNRLELAIKLILNFAIPLMLCLMAWMVFLSNRRRQRQTGAALY